MELDAHNDAPPEQGAPAPAGGRLDAPQRFVPWVWLLAGIAFTLCLNFARRVQRHRWIFGSEPGNHTYPYLRRLRGFSSRPTYLLLAALAFALPLAWLTNRTVRRHEKLSLLAWLVLGLILQLALRSDYRHSLAEIVLSDQANSFYRPTLFYRPVPFLRDYDTIVPTLGQHATSNMPGKVMLFFLLGSMTSSPERMAYLVIILSNLGAVLLYLLVRDIFEDRRAALFSADSLPLHTGQARLLPAPERGDARPRPARALPLCQVPALRPVRIRAGARSRALRVGLLRAAAPGDGARLPGPPGRPAAVRQALAALDRAARRVLRRRLPRRPPRDALRLRLRPVRQSRRARSRRPRLQRGHEAPLPALDVGEPERLLLGRRGVRLRPLRGCASAGRPLRRADAPLACGCSPRWRLLVFLELAGVNRAETPRLWIFLYALVQPAAGYLCSRDSSPWPFCAVLAATLAEDAILASTVGFILP